MKHNPSIIYCSGDGCWYHSRCPKALTPEIKADAELRRRVVDVYGDPLKLSCWRDTPVSQQEAQEAIDRIHPQGREETPEEPSWD